MLSVFRWSIVRLFLVTCLFCLRGSAADDGRPKPEKASSVKVKVGNFWIPMVDDRLDQIIKNATYNATTLTDNVWNLYSAVYDEYFEIEDFLNETDSRERMTPLVKRNLNQTDIDSYYDILWNTAVAVAKESKSADDVELGFELPNPDYIWYFDEAVYNMTEQINWFFRGAYMGVGRSASCAQYINDAIASKDEWSKMGSGAATALMAVVPTLIALGSLYQPRNSEVYATSALVGLSTGLYSLGLPVKSHSAVRSSNLYSLAGLGIAAVTLIGNLGLLDWRTGRAKYNGPIADLQNITTDSTSSDPTKARLSGMRDSIINEWRERWHCWHLPNIVVAAAQIIMFALAIYPLFTYIGLPFFIFSCNPQFNLTGIYIIVSAVVNTILRYVLWEVSDHERAKAYALSPLAIESLTAIVQSITHYDELESTATDVPPLYPQIFRLTFEIGIRLRQSLFGGRGSTMYRGHGFSKLEQNRWKNDQHKFGGSIRSLLQSVRSVFANIFSYTELLAVSTAGFSNKSKAARRLRPVYILVHLSPDGRKSFRKLISGFFEAALLLVLTIFFASQWGGNLYITSVAVGLLLLFIVLGRALGLVYVWISSRVWGLSVVQCDSVDEVRGVLRILCSMKGCLVEVNGATYFEGYRMDVLGKSWNDFKHAYDMGKYDGVPEKAQKQDEDDDTDTLSMDIYGSMWTTDRTHPEFFHPAPTAQPPAATYAKPSSNDVHGPAVSVVPAPSPTPASPPDPRFFDQASYFPETGGNSAGRYQSISQFSKTTRYTPAASSEIVEMESVRHAPGRMEARSPSSENIHDRQPLVEPRGGSGLRNERYVG